MSEQIHRVRFDSLPPGLECLRDIPCVVMRRDDVCVDEDTAESEEQVSIYYDLLSQREQVSVFYVQEQLEEWVRFLVEPEAECMGTLWYEVCVLPEAEQILWTDYVARPFPVELMERSLSLVDGIEVDLDTLLEEED